MNDELIAAYDECLHVASSHYENFPVASWLVPKHLRIHVATIYNFARRADDLADEGEANAEDRITALENMGKALDNCLAGEEADDYLFAALANTVPHKDFAEVLDYCNRSANPVGRLMLQLLARSQNKTIRTLTRFAAHCS